MLKKIFLILPLFLMAFAVTASAETVIVKHGHRDWHPHHHKTVIIKHGHDHDR